LISFVKIGNSYANQQLNDSKYLEISAQKLCAGTVSKFDTQGGGLYGQHPTFWDAGKGSRSCYICVFIFSCGIGAAHKGSIVQ
jgi:hypothetical protein